MIKKYKITPIVWLVRDEASVKFHVKSDDYFGTIATVLNLLKQQIKKDGVKNAALDKTFKNLEKDLLWLQKNYQIAPKSQTKVKFQINLKSQAGPKLKSNPKPKTRTKLQTADLKANDQTALK